MKRSMILTLAVALFAPISLMGCGEETKVESKTTKETPGGKETETKVDKVVKEGDAKPDAAK